MTEVAVEGSVYDRWKDLTPEEQSERWALMELRERKDILKGVYHDHLASKDSGGDLVATRTKAPPSDGVAKLKRLFDGLTTKQKAALEKGLMTDAHLRKEYKA